MRRFLLVLCLVTTFSLCIAFVSCGGGTRQQTSQSATPDTPPAPPPPPPPPAPTPTIAYSGVLRWRFDAGVTGQNPNEKTLTQANVNSTQFGKLFSYDIDGQAFAQPLYVSQVAIEGKGTHNVVFVATEHNTVYAFDADNKATLWTINFNDAAAGTTPVPSDDVTPTPGTGAIKPEIGITSTPVIDSSTGILYVVAATKENGTHVHRIHAIDITTGKEKVPNVRINPGASFDSRHNLQRAALTLSDGVVYVCFASYGDWTPYHGWIVGYDASSLQQVVALNTTPDGGEGSIWQAGAGLSVDADGRIFVVIANGSFNADKGGKNYGDSVVRLTPKTLTFADYFTPFNQASLNAGDIDMGSGGLTLLPDQAGPNPHLAVTAGKEGRIYLLNRDNLGKFNAANDSQIVQSIPNQLGDLTRSNARNFSTPAYFQGNIYFIANRDVIKQFKLTNGLLATSPVAAGTHVYGFPGGNMSVSSNGANDGIVWAIEAGGGNVLHAYDATNVARELYNSAQAGARDSFGNAVRFTVPVVINGKVYVGAEKQLAVFGLLQ
jgi:hypothetical protein